MSDKKSFAIVLCILLLSGFMTTCKSRMNNQIETKERDIEVFLRTASIVHKEISPEGGRTAPWKITLNDGKIEKEGHFKYIDRTRPSPIPDSYKYEIAAYILNRLLDLNICPPIVEREIEGMKGSLQLFIENCINETHRRRQKLEPTDTEGFYDTLEEINVFENLVNEEDCFDSDDTLVQLDSWKLWRVDFSRAFSPVKELIPECKINRCSKKFFRNLKKLDNKVIKSALNPYLNKEEIGALLARKKIILKKITELIKEKGEDSILFS